MTSFDAIVIGGGHNGLTAATVLARGGRKVLVLEADARTGGGARTDEIAPGYRVSGLAHIVNRLDAAVIRATGMTLPMVKDAPAPTAVLSLEKGPIVLRGAYGESIDGVTPAEAAAFRAMKDKLLFQADILKRFLRRRPPQTTAIGLNDLKDFSLAGLKLISRGREEGRDFLRMVLMNVADIADEYLTDDRLKGLLAFDATLGVHLGPRSPTSLLGLYYRLTGDVSGKAGAQLVPRGGMGSVARAFEEAATAAGVTIRISSPVTRILCEKGRASGVELAGGEIIPAGTVVSAIHPKATFLDLVGPAEIDTIFKKQISKVRSKGNVAKLDLALRGTPQFTGLAPADHGGRIVIARGIRHVEEAFNPAKYGAYSPDPVMEITIPSISDPSLAPEGGSVMSVLAQFAPYELKEGWETGGPAFADLLLATLERHAPGLRAQIVQVRLQTPADIERIYRMPGGHWHHGELQVDQLLINRPVDLASGYGTPIAGLYLASAGAHPGGGISGLPGLLAAQHILSGGQ